MNIKQLETVRKPVFMEEAEIKQMLARMEDDDSYNTTPVLIKERPGSLPEAEFKSRHLEYLKTHPKVNPAHYLSNLRTVLRVRA